MDPHETSPCRLLPSFVLGLLAWEWKRRARGDQGSRGSVQQAEPQTQCGRNKERGCVYCLPGAIHVCLELVSSFHEPLDPQIPLLSSPGAPRLDLPASSDQASNTHRTQRARAVCSPRGFKLLVLAPPGLVFVFQALRTAASTQTEAVPEGCRPQACPVLWEVPLAL